MTKTTRAKIYIGLLLCGLIAILALIIVQIKAKTVVANFLSAKIPSHLHLTYENMEVNVLTGTIDIDEVRFKLSNRDTTLVHTEIKSEKLLVEGIQYVQFLFNNTLAARTIELRHPEMLYYQSRKIPQQDSTSQGVVNLLKTIKVDKLAITDGSFYMFGQSDDSVQLSTRNINFNLFDAKTDPEIIRHKMPLLYGGYTFSADSIALDLGKYEMLNVANLMVDNDAIAITELQLHTKYKKEKLSKILRKEHDHVTLEIPEITIDKIDFGFLKNRFFVSATNADIIDLSLTIYRDKTLPDNSVIKDYYSRSLRQLPFDIDIAQVALINANVTYEELVDVKAVAGKIHFTNLDGSGTNLTNHSKNDKLTQFSLTSEFMGSSLVEMEWSFDVNDLNDAFTASGSISRFESKSANSFLRPILNIETEGDIEQLYFTIYGNAKRSQGDMKMNYDNFRFKILKKDKSGVNKLLTAIGNIFINDGSNSDSQGFRYGKIDVERDPTKSVFNYLWLNIEDGIIDTMAGDGKK